MKLRVAMTKTSPNDVFCVAWVLVIFFLTIDTNSQDNFKVHYYVLCRF